MKSALQPGYSTSGGYRHTGVIGFISPSETVAKRWTTAPAVAVGCPKLDQYRGSTPLVPNSVCIAFHWDCLISPEARSAWPYYAASLREIVAEFKRQGWHVYGHAHPKWEGTIDGDLTMMGMELIRHEESLFQVCSALIVDNSSIAYEFASLDRPVVSLNAPWYRRDIEHGMRFWSHVPGRQIDTPQQLFNLDLSGLVKDSEGLEPRRRAAEFAYAFSDGSSSRRAAEFIMSRLDEM